MDDDKSYSRHVDAILLLSEPRPGVFLDFGSGCGKNCLAAALLHPFQKACQRSASEATGIDRSSPSSP